MCYVPRDLTGFHADFQYTNYILLKSLIPMEKKMIGLIWNLNNFLVFVISKYKIFRELSKLIKYFLYCIKLTKKCITDNLKDKV